MANDNETVEQVCGEFKTSSHTCKNCDFEVCPSIIVFADRIIAAHNREIDAIAAQKTAEAHEAFVKNAELADAIAAKDAEIARWRDQALQEDAAAEALSSENARLRVIVSGATVAEGNLREEIVRLRALVGELADALYGFRDAPCDSCMLNRCPGIEKCKETNGTVLLVAKAREVVK